MRNVSKINEAYWNPSRSNEYLCMNKENNGQNELNGQTKTRVLYHKEISTAAGLYSAIFLSLTTSRWDANVLKHSIGVL